MEDDRLPGAIQQIVQVDAPRQTRGRSHDRLKVPKFGHGLESSEFGPTLSVDHPSCNLFARANLPQSERRDDQPAVTPQLDDVKHAAADERDAARGLFSDERIAGDVRAIAARLAEAAPIALRTMKANFLDAERMSFRDFIAAESRRHIDIFKTEDTREAFRAKVEKRKPNFQGR